MYLRSMYPDVPPLPPTNYHNVLFHSPMSQGLSEDYTMYIDALTERKYTRKEFMNRMFNVATALGSAGLNLDSSHMVGILSDNCLDYPVVVHALLMISTPFALFSTYATPREMTHSLERSKATHMIVHASLLPSFLPVARQLGFPENNIYVLEGKQPDTSPSFPSLDDLIEQVVSAPRETVRPAGHDTLAYLVFSSGTSGLPKAVMVSHGNLCVSLLQGVIVMQEYIKVNPPVDTNSIPVSLGFLPLFHSYGLHYICLRPPTRAVTMVLLPRWNLDLVLNSIPKYRITTLALIPSVIHTLLTSPKLASTDLSSVVSFGSGAAYLPPALSEKMGKAIPGAVLIEGYGMSEATLSLLGRPHKGILDGRAEDAPSASGILQPGVEALILRADGTHCLPDEPGDLYVKGRHITLGYWNDPKATKETFLGNGWLKTGDRFRANNKGTFWFQDRAKDILKVSGMQVSPAEIEDVLLAEPAGLITDAAVAGVQLPDARTNDELCPRAWVVLSPKGKELGIEKTRAVLEEWTKTNLSKYKWIRGGIEVMDELPKTPTGKTLRRVLKDRYAAAAAPQAKL